MKRLPVNLVAQLGCCPPLVCPEENDTAHPNDPVDYPDRRSFNQF